MIQYEKVTGDFDLTGKNAIVVGGAGGIGEATARMYAKKGANVAIVDCKDNCPEVAEAISKEFGVKTVGVKCDVTQQESVDYGSLVVLPGICIMLAVLAFNLLGDGLRDALDPRLKD